MTDSSSARGTAAAWKAVALPSLLWWARELLAALLWGVALAHLFVLDVGYTIESRLPAVAVFVRYRLFVLLAVAALIWLAFGGRWFLRSFGYVIAYPLVLLFWQFPKIMFRNSAAAIAFSPAIYQLLTTLRASFVFGVAAVSAGFIACLAPAETRLIAPALVVVGMYLGFHYFRRLRIAYASPTVFAEVGSRLNSAWHRVRSAVLANPLEGDPDSEEFKQKQAERLLQAYMFTAVLHFLAAGFRDVMHSRKLDLYLVGSLVWTFALTVIAFAVFYFGLARLEPGSFSGVTSPGFIDFVGFSFATLMTSSISPLVAASGIAQLLTYIQLVGSFLIIVLLAFIILTSKRERYRQDLDELVRELGVAEEQAALQIEENFALTLPAVERRLLRYNEAITEWLLGLRYGKARAKEMVEQVRAESGDAGDAR